MNTHSWDNDDCQCVQYYGDRRIISFLEDFWREKHNWPGRLSNIHGDEVLMRRVWSRLRLLNLFKVNPWLWLLVETLFSGNRGKPWSSNFENRYAHFRIHLSFAEPEARHVFLRSSSFPCYKKSWSILFVTYLSSLLKKISIAVQTNFPLFLFHCPMITRMRS